MTEEEVTPSDATASSIQLLIDMIRNEKSGELRPIYDLNHGCSYPEVEKLLNCDRETAIQTLQELVLKGVLSKRSFEKIVSCPRCGSHKLTLRFLCPNCRSHDLTKKSLMEHFKCGYIGADENFRREDRLVCPKCRTELKERGVDHRYVGAWYECNSCKKRFDDALTPFRCRNCGEHSTLTEALLLDCYSFFLADGSPEKLPQEFGYLKPIRDMLNQMGYEVRTSALLDGRSGASHRFDLIATQKGKDFRVLIDIATEEDTISEDKVSTMFAKIFDIGKSKSFLVAVPKISERGKKLASQYKISVIEGKDFATALEHLRQALRKL